MLTDRGMPALLDPALRYGKLRATVFAKIPRATLTQALEDIRATVRAPDDVVLPGNWWGDIVAFEAFFRKPWQHYVVRDDGGIDYRAYITPLCGDVTFVSARAGVMPIHAPACSPALTGKPRDRSFVGHWSPFQL
jgi:hypothetical protein